MKNILFIILLLPVFAFAQSNKLIVEGSAPDYYINHTTGPKENFYSIGRIYNISPRVFAPYNHLEMDKGLSIGQVVRIPLNEINYSEKGVATEDELIVPLYTKVKGKENFLGYLKVKKELSPLAAHAISPKKIIQSANEAGEVKQVAKSEPIVKNVEPTVVKTTIRQNEETAPASPQFNKSEEKKITKTETEAVPDFKGGFFADAFGKQIIKTNYIPATGGVFKSTSGWKDGKYYCFHNIADAGTIIKITNPANGKSVYAKVLDVIPDISENQGINIRISNSAADELGVSGDSFGCKLSY